MDGNTARRESEDDLEPADDARFLKTLGNASRLRILAELRKEPLQVGDLESRLGMSQAYVSQQLARLRAEGIVAGDRHGRSVRYRVVDDRVGFVLDSMHRFRTARQSGGVGKL